jgi:predicted peptidase
MRYSVNITMKCFAMSVLVLCVSVLASPATAQQANDAMTDMLKVYEAREYQGVSYRLMKPIDLSENPDKKYPLILSLHGAGGRGNDNRKNLRNWNGIMAEEKRRRTHPAFVVVPQSQIPWIVAGATPEITDEMIVDSPPIFHERLKIWQKRKDMYKQGKLQVVFALLDELAEEFNIDTDRVYVLGHSMGGAGTWTAISEQPKRFAAALPTAGALSNFVDVRTIAKVPIWSFHGDIDPTVSVEFTRYAFEQLKTVKGNMKYTELKGVKHNANYYAYEWTGDDPDKGFVTQYASDRCDKKADVWDWLFAQKRKQ